jgi:RNA-binding protein YlmH
MGLGLRRETIGDILPGSQGADLLVMAEIAPYIQQNLTQVGSAPASVQLISLSELEIPEAKIKIIRDTVPSLRLDAVLAAAFSMSRGDAAEAVRRGLAQVDGAQALKGDRPVAQGARLSIRGKGKAVLAETGGFSKKGRVNIEIHKLL